MLLSPSGHAAAGLTAKTVDLPNNRKFEDEDHRTFVENLRPSSSEGWAFFIHLLLVRNFDAEGAGSRYLTAAISFTDASCVSLVLFTEVSSQIEYRGRSCFDCGCRLERPDLEVSIAIDKVHAKLVLPHFLSFFDVRRITSDG